MAASGKLATPLRIVRRWCMVDVSQTMDDGVEKGRQTIIGQTDALATHERVMAGLGPPCGAARAGEEGLSGRRSLTHERRAVSRGRHGARDPRRRGQVRFRLAFLLFTVLGVCLIRAAWAEPIKVNTTPIALHPANPPVERLGDLAFLGGLILTSPDPRFGGLSGLTFGDQGFTLVAVSDHGFWVTFEPRRDAGGRLMGIANARIVSLRDEGGQPLAAKRLADAEAVERMADGRFVVSFERTHRLWRYEPHAATGDWAPPARATPLGDLPGHEHWPVNGGIEALAALPGDRFLAVSEDVRNVTGDLRGWLVEEGRSRPVTYAATGDFQPTDFALLPSGDVLALERAFSPLAGASARLQIIARQSLRPGGYLKGREIARIKPPLTTDNFKGLAVTEDDEGSILIYVVSDDNYSALQRTLLFLFRLAD